MIFHVHEDDSISDDELMAAAVYAYDSMYKCLMASMFYIDAVSSCAPEDVLEEAL